MSKNHTTATRSVKWMRWIARIVSILWAYVASILTLFLMAMALPPKELISMAVFGIIMLILTLMFFGGAILASVWGKEKLGGGLLILSSAVLLTFLVYFAFLQTGELFRIPGLIIPSVTVLPALLSGALFLICHRKTRHQ